MNAAITYSGWSVSNGALSRMIATSAWDGAWTTVHPSREAASGAMPSMSARFAAVSYWAPIPAKPVGPVLRAVPCIIAPAFSSSVMRATRSRALFGGEAPILVGIEDAVAVQILELQPVLLEDGGLNEEQ